MLPVLVFLAFPCACIAVMRVVLRFCVSLAESDEEKAKLLRWRGFIRGFTVAYFAMVLVWSVQWRVSPIQLVVVSGASMEDNYYDKDMMLVEKISYSKGSPKRFDVIVFEPEGEDGVLYVKRVIGLPGETVQIVANTIFIDGEPLEENYGNGMISYDGIAAMPVTLGDGEYFVLGDNRYVSKDSRSPEVGAVSKGQVRGRVFFRVFPFSRFGFTE